MAAETIEARRPSSRSKRAAILEAATASFGREGYEDSKWADVAKAVGIGSTALYHYFESKLHCLYSIMADALEARLEEFQQDTKGAEDFHDALVTVLKAGFDLSEQEILRNRVLIAEQALLAVHRTSQREEDTRITSEPGDFNETLETLLRAGYELSEQEVLRNRVVIAEQALLGIHRTSPREEEARRRSRERTRDLEFAWATFLSRGMEQGAIPEADPRLLTRAVLGLHNSVWHWYRPGGDLSLDEVNEFFVGRCLAVLGVPAERPARKAAPKRRRSTAKK
jgi:TetR/AcrR family transcriptional regulator, cholesterol catabolism regulator